MVLFPGCHYKLLQRTAHQGSGFPVCASRRSRYMLVDFGKFQRVRGPWSGYFETLYTTVERLGPLLLANLWSAGLRVVYDTVNHMAG
jgi:hypothetical protein